MQKKDWKVLAGLGIFVVAAGALTMFLDEKKEETEYPAMEQVELDKFSLNEIKSPTFQVEYPSNVWQGEAYDGTILLQYNKDDSGLTGIMIKDVGEYQGTITESMRDSVTDDMLAYMDDSYEVVTNELRRFDGEKIIYLEAEVDYGKLYEASIEKEKFTEQQWEEMGGREALENLPTLKTINILQIKDNRLYQYVASYSNDDEKNDILETLNILMQTLKGAN